MIRFRIDEVVFGIADARRHLIAVDPQAQAALTDVRRSAEADASSRKATHARLDSRLSRRRSNAS